MICIGFAFAACVVGLRCMCAACSLRVSHVCAACLLPVRFMCVVFVEFLLHAYFAGAQFVLVGIVCDGCCVQPSSSGWHRLAEL